MSVMTQLSIQQRQPVLIPQKTSYGVVARLEGAGCRANNNFIDIDIIWLGHSIQDGSGDRIRG